MLEKVHARKLGRHGYMLAPNCDTPRFAATTAWFRDQEPLFLVLIAAMQSYALHTTSSLLAALRTSRVQFSSEAQVRLLMSGGPTDPQPLRFQGPYTTHLHLPVLSTPEWPRRLLLFQHAFVRVGACLP
jgi:hypothetical protein